MINIEKSLSIPGWMSQEELTWLAKAASDKTCIVEVGSYVGRSTRALADNTKGTVIAIDDFYGPRASSDIKPDGTKFTEEDRVVIYDQFVDNLKDHIESGKVIPIRASCEKLDSIFSARKRLSKLTEVSSDDSVRLKTDFVFIDGDHSYPAVCRDIKFWKKHLTKGGLMSGHDSNYPPVKQAVAELLTNINYAQGTSIWFTII